MPTSTIKTARFNKIALTTGDPNGIGFEVAAKALVQLKKDKPAVLKKNLFILFRDHRQHISQKSYFKLLDRHFNRITFFNFDLANTFIKTLTNKDFSKNNYLIDLALTSSAAHWVFQATQACIDKKIDSIVTGPLSKSLIDSSGFSQIGHTGIFRSFFPKKTLHMGFIGRDFNILIATDHIPISKVSSSLTKADLNKAYASALILKKVLKLKAPRAVLGLNPHSGECGLIGREELSLFKNLPSGIVGPLVPDAAFLKKNWKKYSVFVCLYHDQGLIPFKMHHGQDSGVHITLGLPFIRTSVDHGTAFDLFNKNGANFASMLDAINLNLKLLES